MKIKVNGNVQDISKQLSVVELLELNKVEQPDMVSVQINGNFIARDAYFTTLIKENDEIDFLYFMGGGNK